MDSSNSSDHTVVYVIPSVLIVLMISTSLIIAWLLNRATTKLNQKEAEENEMCIKKRAPVIFHDEMDGAKIIKHDEESCFNGSGTPQPPEYKREMVKLPPPS